MKTAQIYLVSFIVTASLTLGMIAYGKKTTTDPGKDVETAITMRRVDPMVKLERSYRIVTEKELQWFATWHESDDLIYDANGIFVYYNDTHDGADQVWIYEVN